MNKELLEKFLSDAGAPDELKSAITADEPDQNFDYAAVAEKWKSSRRAVWSKLLEPEHERIISEKTNERVDQLIRQTRDKINTKFELGFSDDDFGNFKSFSDFVKAGADKISAKLKEASKETDAELRERLNSLSTTLQTRQAEYESEINQYKEQIEAEKKRADQVIAQFEIDRIFANEFSSIEWGIEHAPTVELWKKNIQNQIQENYRIDPGSKTITDRKTGGPAVNFGKNGTYALLNEAISDLIAINNLDKRSNGGSGGSGGDGGGSGGDGGDGSGRIISKSGAINQSRLSENAKAMFEKFNENN